MKYENNSAIMEELIGWPSKLYILKLQAFQSECDILRKKPEMEKY